MEVFADVILPPRVVRAGISGKNRRSNARVMNQGGYDSINIIWTRTLREYQLGIVDRDVEAWAAIQGLHELTEGGAYGFLLEDPKDHTVLMREGRIAADGGPVAQLVKAYGVTGSSREVLRAITRIKSANFRRGVDPLTGVTVNDATGVITMPYDAAHVILSITTGATTQITLAAAVGLPAGGLLYVAGVGGSSAALLNSRAHVITAVAGAVYTLAVDTSGASFAVSGTGAAYPQPSEGLAWSGAFYVPVHFVSDDIDWSLSRGGPTDEVRLVSGDAITVMEVRE